jgi:hypothetical protein
LASFDSLTHCFGRDSFQIVVPTFGSFFATVWVLLDCLLPCFCFRLLTGIFFASFHSHTLVHYIGCFLSRFSQPQSLLLLVFLLKVPYFGLNFCWTPIVSASISVILGSFVWHVLVCLIHNPLYCGALLVLLALFCYAPVDSRLYISLI